MRIGVVTNSVSRHGAGLFESVRSLCCAFPATNTHTLKVFGLRDEHTDEDLVRWEPIRPVTCVTRGPRRFGYAPALTRVLDNASLDILHSHGLWMYPSYASYQWSRHHGRPSVVSLHGMLDSEALRVSHFRKTVARWLFEDAHLRSTTCLHALSLDEATSIRNLGLTNPICIIPNGIELPSGIDAPSTELPNSPKTLLYLGRLHPIKNLVGLLRAWRELCQQSPALTREWQLVLAGWSQQGHAELLGEFCTMHGLKESVRFIGPQFNEHKARAYRTADAFVLPSLNEALPMVVLEAWAYGLPVAMTPECHLQVGYGAGAAIPIASEATAMVEGLRKLLSMTDAERRAMGERGYQLVRARFVWSKIAHEMAAVYHWLLGLGAVPDCVWGN